MAEQVHEVTVCVEVDTNNRTVAHTFDAEDFDDFDELFAAARAWLADVLDAETSGSPSMPFVASFTGHPDHVQAPSLMWEQGFDPPVTVTALAAPPGGLAHLVVWRRVGTSTTWRCQDFTALEG